MLFFAFFREGGGVLRLGLHFSISEGLLGVTRQAKTLGCQTGQIFTRSPRGGKARAFSETELEQFHRSMKEADLKPLVVHVPYYLNLASPDKTLRSRGLELLCEDLERAGILGADYLVTHTGKHLGAGETEGIAWVTEAVHEAVARVENRVTLLVENMSGAGTEVGYTLEQLADIGVGDTPRLGVCLDTCHAFAAGYDLRDPDAVDRFVSEFDRILGIDCLFVIHANDSYYPFQSRKDRHMHIGKGHIGLPGFRAIVNHPVLKKLPFILETPEKEPGDARRNLETMRALEQAQDGE